MHFFSNSLLLGHSTTEVKSWLIYQAEDLGDLVAQTQTSQGFGCFDIILRAQLGKDALEVGDSRQEKTVLVLEISQARQSVCRFVATRCSSLMTSSACRSTAVALQEEASVSSVTFRQRMVFVRIQTDLAFAALTC